MLNKLCQKGFVKIHDFVARDNIEEIFKEIFPRQVIKKEGDKLYIESFNKKPDIFFGKNSKVEDTINKI